MKIRFSLTMLFALILPLLVFADASMSPNTDDSRWLAKFQSTYVWQTKPAFHADYSGPNSLRADAEKSYTFSATAYLGARLWEGAELYVNPEVVQGAPLSKLVGLGGETNGEAQKVAGTNPKLYRARLFLRQTIALGGDRQALNAGFNQFAEIVDSRRVVITVGNFALNDIFDGNAYSHDPRTQFLNWSLIGYGTWDFAADARGFTQAAVVEFYADDWVARLARAELPLESNGLALNARIFHSYGDNAEVEPAYTLGGQAGKVRALGYRNVAAMGTYPAANALAAATADTPDIALVRERRAKTGFGVSLEQSFSDTIGGFARRVLIGKYTMTASTKAIAALLTVDNILLDLDMVNKEQMFQAVAQALQSRTGLPQAQMIDSLRAREQLGCTAIGAGVAVPHSRVRGLTQALALYIRPRAPIPFDAPDGKPVAHIVVIFVPEQATHAHLQLLAGVAELFQDANFKAKLGACKDAINVTELFREYSE